MTPSTWRTLFTVYSTISVIVGVATPACAITCLVLVRRTNRALAELSARLEQIPEEGRS